MSPPRNASCDNLCEFGRWLYGPSLDLATRSGIPYNVVRRLHAEFHDCAGRVLALALEGKATEAAALLEGEYTARSDKLVVALTK